VRPYAQQIYGIPPEQVVGTAATHALTGNKAMGLAFSARGQCEVAMRILLFIAGVFVAILFIEKPAEAQNYPWCAEYGGTPSGPTNCGFVTFQQCLDTVSGIGGFCVRNNLYQPPPGPHPSAKKMRTRPPY
jgi:hypothetical protein